MRLKKLASQPDGAIMATLQTKSGEEIEIVFTTEQRAGITVASPQQPHFEFEGLDAANVRTIVAAVIAFDRAVS